MNIHERIKFVRTNKKMTLEELAFRIGKTKQTVQKYESGVINNVPLEAIEKIADVLKTTPIYLLGWTENKNDPRYVMEETPLYKAFEKTDAGVNDLTEDEINNIVKFFEFIKSTRDDKK